MTDRTEIFPHGLSYDDNTTWKKGTIFSYSKLRMAVDVKEDGFENGTRLKSVK